MPIPPPTAPLPTPAAAATLPRATCWPGTARTAATCRGATPPIRTTSSSRRSCCSRRRSIACCRSTTSGSASIRRSTRSPRRRQPRSRRRGGRSATTSGRSGCSRSRSRRSRTYDGKLPSDRDTLLSFKGIGEYTAGAIRSFAFRERAAILDTNVARVLFRIFVGKGDPKSHAMKKHLWAVSRGGAAPPPRLRLQPGADGLRRHALQRAQTEVRRVLDAGLLPERRRRSARQRRIRSRSASGNGSASARRFATQRISCPIIGFATPSRSQR